MERATGSRTIGVIGGMGPLATADLYRKIIEETPAARDQEHFHVVIDADPSVPDRTAAIQGQGPDPLPQLTAMARRLEAAGVGLLVMPCNTAHAFLPALREMVALPIIDMIREAAREVIRIAPDATRIGVLATAGTVMSGLYDRALEDHGVTAIYPDDAGQLSVGDGIHEVKAGSLETAAERFVAVANALTASGADVLIAGCTEIPIVLEASMTPLPLVDPTRVLARAAVHWARSGECGST